MLQNPPANMPRITAYLLYEDVGPTVDWLANAFGFRERMRLPRPGGKIMHAEMEYADGVVMMGCPGPEYRNPKHTGHVAQSLYVYVDDVDKHYQHAVKAGARILAEPADQFYGDRTYRAEDPEGHHWTFGQHIRDVSPEELCPPQ